MAPMQPSTSRALVLPSQKQPGLLHLRSCGDLSTFVPAGRPPAEQRPRRAEAERPHSLIGVIRETVLWSGRAGAPEEQEDRWALEGRELLERMGPLSVSWRGVRVPFWLFFRKRGHSREHLFLLLGSRVLLSAGCRPLMGEWQVLLAHLSSRYTEGETVNEAQISSAWVHPAVSRSGSGFGARCTSHNSLLHWALAFSGRADVLAAMYLLPTESGTGPEAGWWTPIFCDCQASC